MNAGRVVTADESVGISISEPWATLLLVAGSLTKRP